MFEDLFKRIDDSLNPKDKIKKTDYTIFENKMAKSFGMVTESLDSFLNIIEHPTNKNHHQIFEYLKTATPAEIEDWINALDIAVVDREVLNRWTLSLAQKTSEELNVPAHMKPILSGVLEALGVQEWEGIDPTQGGYGTEDADIEGDDDDEPPFDLGGEEDRPY